ncbi:MAG: S-adenosylmethionine:tRNA ribosyltransferase-isomerase [Deltaproteobacteria bacterium SG8_13]|nr:MAG: S-adenosylmethionine:tRNA ribosyltransferase-isomerase [Deltaproteobacteria bacterium SG8_13]
MYSLSDYHYELPEKLIAQKPIGQRDRSRLLVLDRRTGAIAHGVFSDLPRHLSAGDVLVVNDTQVIPARLFGRKGTGGRVEILLIDYAGGKSDTGRFVTQCLVKSSKSPRIGSEIDFEGLLKARVLDGGSGVYTLEFYFQGSFEDRLYELGRTPLPPYIKRPAQGGEPVDDRLCYQTVYASRKGAVAAPTAGLHFTDELLLRIQSAGVRIVRVTLHVGYGTFLPVRVSDIRQHRMHAERYILDQDAAETIQRAVGKGKRVIAVGTTCVRTLEHAARENGRPVASEGESDLFIYPGYRFKVVGGLVTNFHLPRSTLLMLVSAFAGRENILNAYTEAIRRQYRFYSYGDAMLIV